MDEDVVVAQYILNTRRILTAESVLMNKLRRIQFNVPPFNNSRSTPGRLLRPSFKSLTRWGWRIVNGVVKSDNEHAKKEEERERETIRTNNEDEVEE